MAVVVRAGTSRESARRTALRTGETVIDTEGDILFTGDGQAWSPGLGIPEDVFQNSDGDFIPADSPRARSERGVSSTGTQADVQGGEPQVAEPIDEAEGEGNILPGPGQTSLDSLRARIANGSITRNRAIEEYAGSLIDNGLDTVRAIDLATRRLGEIEEGEAGEGEGAGAGAGAGNQNPVPDVLTEGFDFEVDPLTGLTQQQSRQFELSRTFPGRQQAFREFIEASLGPSLNPSVRNVAQSRFDPANIAFNIAQSLNPDPDQTFTQFVQGLGGTPTRQSVTDALTAILGQQGREIGPTGDSPFTALQNRLGERPNLATDIALLTGGVGQFSPVRSAFETAISNRFNRFLGTGGMPIDFLFQLPQFSGLRGSR